MPISIQNYELRETSDPTAGWMATGSGAFGVAAVGFLITHLVLRSTNNDHAMLMARLHDVGVILQVLLMIPVVLALYKCSHQQSKSMSRYMLIVGIGALSFTALFLLLGLLKAMADVLYMFPQGIFGAWLVAFCVRSKGMLSRGHKWFGIIVGFGLALVGTFPLGYAIFVDTIILNIPAAAQKDVEKVLINYANMVVHQILFIGSLMGVLTFPFWTLLIARRLLRMRG
jgi:hypothetical protein